MVALLIVPSVCAQQSQLDATVSRVVGAIRNSSQKIRGNPKILVAAFAEKNQGPTALGAELARNFSESLLKAASDFTLLDAGAYVAASQADQLSPKAYSDLRTTECYGDKLDADFVISGEVTEISDRVALRIKAMRVRKWKIIFDDAASLQLTLQMQSLASQPLPGNAIPPGASTVLWIGPGYHPADEQRAVSVSKLDENAGYVRPKCLRCRRADYSSAALNFRIQGTVELNALIDTEGHPEKISVSQGLACGLNQKAIEAVKKWELTPATGPDGKPLAVWQIVEVSFKEF